MGADESIQINSFSFFPTEECSVMETLGEELLGVKTRVYVPHTALEILGFHIGEKEVRTYS